MGTLGVTLFLLGLLALLLAGGVWIAIVLLAMGWAAMELFTSTPVGKLMATTVWGSSASWALTALPLFIWMGEILFRSRISEDMFRGLVPWLSRLPGRLMHCNVIGCGIFAAISGSSAATAWPSSTTKTRRSTIWWPTRASGTHGASSSSAAAPASSRPACWRSTCRRRRAMSAATSAP